MLKVWELKGDVRYGWCTMVVSANNKYEARRIAMESDSYYMVESLSVKLIGGVFDHNDIPRVLSEEVGQE